MSITASATSASDHSVSRLTFLAFMVTHGRHTADVLASVLSDKFFHLSSHDSTVSLFLSPYLSLPMGRRPWATPKQLEFLESYLPQLPDARGGIGLNVLYTRVAQEFLTRWEPEPVTLVAVAKTIAPTAKTITSTAETVVSAAKTVTPVATPVAETVTPEQLKELAEARLHDVRFIFTYACPTIDSRHQRVKNWYKNALKNTGSVPYKKQHRLDLTGRSARKKPPYQLHQAFSVVNWRPEGSPLRREVNDLWSRRKDSAVCESLNPFVTTSGGIGSLTRLQFHMTVMQWKCSLMSTHEAETLQDWIDEQRVLNGRPWAIEADAYGDELVAENQHIQRSVSVFYRHKSGTNSRDTAASTTYR
jgi:hypothetical protein